MPKPKKFSTPFVGEVEELVRKGATLMTVFAKYGRWNARHRIVVTKKGAIFFPDHGMSSPAALVAELALVKHKGQHMLSDYCYVLATHLCERDFLLTRPSRDPIVAHLTVPNNDWNRETKKCQEFWDYEAHALVRAIRSKRRSRESGRNTGNNPVSKGVPFVKSIRERIEPIERERHERILEKMRRVLSRRF